MCGLDTLTVSKQFTHKGISYVACGTCDKIYSDFPLDVKPPVHFCDACCSDLIGITKPVQVPSGPVLLSRTKSLLTKLDEADLTHVRRLLVQ